MKNHFSLLLITAFFPFLLPAQSTPKDQGLKIITTSSIQGPLEFLASDWMMGRETGTKGAFMASDYIASLYKSIGLKPGGDQWFSSRSYFQNIDFVQTRAGERQECALIRKSGDDRYQVDLAFGQDYSINPGSLSLEAESQVVFVGYGITDKSRSWDDFKGLDVKGKILLRLSGYPGQNDPDSREFKAFNSPEKVSGNDLQRAKNQTAMNLGAVAVIDLRNGSTNFRESVSNLPFRYNMANYEGDVPFNSEVRFRTRLPGPAGSLFTSIQLSDRALTILTEGSNLDVAAYENEAAGGKVLKMGLPADRYLKIVCTVESRIVRGRNVIGVLEGEDTEKCIVVGAHFDHLGEVNGYIYNGSDDNASGTVGVFTIARAMIESGKKPKVTVVFCAWTAEEKGLLGSQYYVAHPLIPDIKCYMNYDMISRLEPGDSTGTKCEYNYTSGLPILKELAEKHIRDYSLNLDVTYLPSEMPQGGSDFSSFSRVGIPIFLVHGGKSGSVYHPDYHQYTDSSDKAALPYYRDIVRLGYLNIYELANKNW